ncbi:unnamed protein product [Rhodiola kirilowii]
MADTTKLRPYDSNTDFSMWKLKMKAILIKEKCYRAIEDTWVANTTDDVKKEIRDLAHSEIIMRLNDHVARQVMTITDPKALWEKLEEKYLSTSLPNRISLLGRLFTFKMDVHMTIQENLDIFLRITQDLDRCKDTIKDEHLAVIILHSLPNQFDIVKDVIQYGRDELTLTKITEMIIQKNETLKVFKTRCGSRTEAKNEVMMFKSKKKFPHKNNRSEKPNHDSQNVPRQPDKNGAPQGTKGKCFYCNNVGHYANHCQKKK